MNQQTLPANNTSQQEEPASFMNLQCVLYRMLTFIGLDINDYALKHFPNISLPLKGMTTHDKFSPNPWKTSMSQSVIHRTVLFFVNLVRYTD